MQLFLQFLLRSTFLKDLENKEKFPDNFNWGWIYL